MAATLASVWAWVLTIPASAAIGALSYVIVHLFIE